MSTEIIKPKAVKKEKVFKKLTKASKMPYGKMYKDKKMEDVPTEYLLKIWKRAGSKPENRAKQPLGVVLDYIEKNLELSAKEEEKAD